MAFKKKKKSTCAHMHKKTQTGLLTDCLEVTGNLNCKKIVRVTIWITFQQAETPSELPS